MTPESAAGPRGRLITLEGGEGTGKTTQARLLATWLALHGLDVLTTREPGGSAGAEEIRRLLVTGAPNRWGPMTEALLLGAARRDHLERTVWPALARGAWVVCDRFADSTLAYQGYGHGLPLERLRALTDLVTDGIEPDLTLVLDLPAEQGLVRGLEQSRQRGEDRFERMDAAFHRRLRDGFLALAAASPGRCVVIDAGAPVDSVQTMIRTAVAARWPSLQVS